MKQTTEPFEELAIPRRDFSISSDMVYRVYKDRRNFEIVEAESALDALARSKIKNAYKIERHDPLGCNVIHLSQVISQQVPPSEELVPDDHSKIQEQPQEIVESVVADAEPVATPESTAVVQETESPPASGEPAALSNDDIDKLLNG